MNTYKLLSLVIIHSSFIKKVWFSATPSASVTLSFTYPHDLTLLASNSLLRMSISSFSLTYPHIPDKARMNHHQAPYLVSIRLIFVFFTSVTKIMMIRYTVSEIWCVPDVIVIFHVGIFLPCYPPNNPRN